jgi:hypothetical protein
MNTVWKILNSPLVVVLIALALWPLLSTLSARFALQNVIGGITGDVKGAYSGLKDTQMKQDRAKMAALKGIEVKGVKLAAGRFKGRQKVIGTLMNKGTRTVKQIKVTLSYFDGAGGLIDVDTSWLNNIAFLKPGEEANFSANRGFDRKTGAPAKRVSIKVTALSVVEEGKK